MNKSILVIGGAGYIGPVITAQLLSAGHRVVCLDLLLYENGLSIASLLGNPNYQFIHGDLSDFEALDRALVGITDVVVLGGLVGDPITKTYPVAANLINDKGIIGCIDYLNGKGLDRVIFVSTCSNYGLLDSSDLADELYPLQPLSLYAKSKVAAEHHILSMKGAVDYTPTILRFATAFGLAPRMRFDLTVNEFTLELASGKELLVFDANTWRPYCHVKDFGRLILTVLQAPQTKVAFEVFNAGGEINNFTKQGVVDIICSKVPNARVKYQAQGSDPRNYRVDFTKVYETLGFKPIYSVHDGVVELLDAIGQHIFDNAGKLRNFHGNYELRYPATH
jgi:nucleoside-diphosphate-sugar epimerase